MTVTSFLKYLEVEKRYSDKTIKAYANDLSQFEDFIQTEAGHFSFKDITSYEVRLWIMSLMNQKQSPTTINRKISTLRSYTKYMRREGLLSKDPLAGISALKSQKKLPSFVRAEEMHQLLDEIPFENNFEGSRDKLILEVLYGTGLRVSEMSQLTHEQIDIANRSIKVTGKRNKTRVIPVNDRIILQLNAYLRLKKETFGTSSGILLLTRRGDPVYDKLIYKIVKNGLALVTTSTKKSPHVLRHSFATALLNNGAELNVIKELLGHANLSATEVYTHSTFKDLTKAYKLAHPRA